MTATKKKPAKRKPGRPTVYSDKLAATICGRLAEGESLRTICADDAMPGKSTVLRWLLDGEHKVFRDQYARAREAQADYFADEILAIADDSPLRVLLAALQAGRVDRLVLEYGDSSSEAAIS